MFCSFHLLPHFEGFEDIPKDILAHTSWEFCRCNLMPVLFSCRENNDLVSLNYLTVDSALSHNFNWGWQMEFGGFTGRHLLAREAHTARVSLFLHCVP